MFARKIPNRSGSISVQVIRKEHGKYRVVQTVGTSKDPDEIERLWQKAQYLANHPNPDQPTLFTLQTPSDHLVQSAMEGLSNANLRTIGPELIFGTLFDRIGFNQIPDELFRHLVIARLAYPVSKLKTTDYLYRYKGLTWSVSAVYKFLDRLHSRYKHQAEEITVSIDLRKVEEDRRWDGLKGYLTNTRMDAKTVIENYSHLGKIEKAFRISKTDLRIRPIYHYRKRRIEAHVCIAFVAYAIYMELETLLKQKNHRMSAKRAGELTQTMYELHYTLPDSREEKRFILNMDADQLSLYNVVHEI